VNNAALAEELERSGTAVGLFGCQGTAWMRLPHDQSVEAATLRQLTLDARTV
jgi:hypothetical protein